MAKHTEDSLRMCILAVKCFVLDPHIALEQLLSSVDAACRDALVPDSLLEVLTCFSDIFIMQERWRRSLLIKGCTTTLCRSFEYWERMTGTRSRHSNEDLASGPPLHFSPNV